MQQYFGARDERPGVLLLMRVGDFYEAYGEDAETVAHALQITLTSREDQGDRVAMAGVPHHAVERYVARLIRLGHRVALMDQVEDPRLARGLVKRRVTRVLTRGTVFEDTLLDAGANNHLAAVWQGEGSAGLGVADVSTGEFLVTEFRGEDASKRLIEELARLEPAETVVSALDGEVAAGLGRPVTLSDAAGFLDGRTTREALCRHFGTPSLRGFGCEEMGAAQEAAALLLAYLQSTAPSALAHLRSLGVYSTGDRLWLDQTARRNLELVRPAREGPRALTLLATIDRTVTPMGARLLRRRIEEPLLDTARIEERLDAVAELVADAVRRGDLRAALRPIADMERLSARCSTGMATPRDLGALRTSLRALATLADAAAGSADALGGSADAVGGSADAAGGSRGTLLQAAAEVLRAAAGAAASAGSPRVEAASSAAEALELLEAGLVDEPAATLREGGVIRAGHAPELDLLRRGAADGRSWIAGLEARERERTGIATLKVGFNAVFGYYLEVTRPNLERVPPHYVRKQTTASAERYVTPELKEWEARVLGADEKAFSLETELFERLRAAVAVCAPGVLAAASAVAQIDVAQGLAETAVERRYCRPVVDAGDVIEIRAGRHPVVESLVPPGAFVPNDCLLDGAQNRLHVLTGPNMAGKSTALRQVALIVVLAQAGSFVPADSARIGVVDRVFTRVGAHDELGTGQSTFMVEMTEVATILNGATARSLVMLDEIGRGTSTYDGLSIAWAVAERLLDIGCRALFATHFHHLNDLADQREGVRNYRVAVKERGDSVIWLHRLVPGGTDRSYGLHVARMAGVPPEVVERARQILVALERQSGYAPRSSRSGERNGGDGAGTPARSAAGDASAPARSAGGAPAPARDARIPAPSRMVQLTLFDLATEPVMEELLALDVTSLTPVEALVTLERLQRRAREGRA
ncbi:MAG TPA: DNA mismatch repair protein MutS [Chthonomonadales bacterium]|nr:DNA mismatch repair protein MutS [Chthonomonadales bacterium]